MSMSLIWKRKKEMQNLNKSDSFTAPEGVLGVYRHRAGLLIKETKINFNDDVKLLESLEQFPVCVKKLYENNEEIRRL